MRYWREPEDQSELDWLEEGVDELVSPGTDLISALFGVMVLLGRLLIGLIAGAVWLACVGLLVLLKAAGCRVKDPPGKSPPATPSGSKRRRRGTNRPNPKGGLN
jgi:hypothetical protein